jgi:hypothetical protein
MTTREQPVATRKRSGRRASTDAALIAALVGGASWREAAEASGCSLSTVTRRMADPAFVAELQDARTELIRRCADRLVAGAGQALDTLEAVATDPDAPPSARIAAARAWLDAASRWQSDLVLDARISALERHLGEPGELRLIPGGSRP